MSYKPYKDIKIPKKYGPSAREAIASDIIDHIIKRSLKGKDVNNEKFPPYSPSYVKSLDFKNAGKSKNKVNLRLSFEMLNSLELRNHNAGNLRIGMPKGDTYNSKKAEGNETGSYGQPAGNSKKKRKFIGISDSDLKTILKKYPIRDKEALSAAVAEALAVADEAEEKVDNL